MLRMSTGDFPGESSHQSARPSDIVVESKKHQREMAPGVPFQYISLYIFKEATHVR